MVNGKKLIFPSNQDQENNISISRVQELSANHAGQVVGKN
jgi:hypothetical protein